MTLQSRLVSVFLELNTTEENVLRSLTVLLTLPSTVLVVSATLDTRWIQTTNVSPPTLLFLSVLRTLSSTESLAPVTLESSSKISTLVLLVLLVLHGTDRFATLTLLRLVQLVMSSMPISVSVSQLLLPAETMLTSTELLVCV